MNTGYLCSSVFICGLFICGLQLCLSVAMNYREFGRLGWPVSEIGYGMWGMARMDGIGR